MDPIIKNLTDTDYYTYTTMQASFYSDFSTVPVRQKFKWRNLDKSKLAISIHDLKDKINEQIGYLSELKYSPEELAFLHADRNMTHRFIKFFIQHYKINKNHIKVWIDENQELNIEVKGPWIFIRPIETPLLAIVEQLIMQNSGKYYADLYSEADKRLEDKIEFLNTTLSLDDYSFIEFGTRRRWDRKYHYHIIDRLKSLPYFKGTSNVYMSMINNLEPIGTMDHQYISTFQQLNCKRIDSQKVALDHWQQFYENRLLIALTDTLGFDKFLKDFDYKRTMIWSGGRHDSGDPYNWGEKFIKHYEKLKINSENKIFVFSDGLTFIDSVNLWSHFKGRCIPISGIGTHISNDCGLTPANIVLKTIEVNENPVAKISDSDGKGMCLDKKYEESFKEEIRKDVEK